MGATHNIVKLGFRLPTHMGMFGRGIYLARCPLKTWQHCTPTRLRLPFSAWKMPGVIIVCAVPSQRIKYAKRKGDHHGSDTVVGLPVEHGGTLRVPELVVYDPGSVSVKYVIEVAQAEDASVSIPWVGGVGGVQPI